MNSILRDILTSLVETNDIDAIQALRERAKLYIDLEDSSVKHNTTFRNKEILKLILEDGKGPYRCITFKRGDHFIDLALSDSPEIFSSEDIEAHLYTRGK